MKTIAPAAMAAIEAGEAIVAGAVEIIGQIPAPIDSGTVDLEWQQSTLNQTPDDQARMGISFIDIDGTQIGATTWATMIATTPGVWTERTLSASVPAGTCWVRLHMEQDRMSGNNSDGYIDAIVATLDGNPLSIVNAGAELGTTSGWTILGGGLGVYSSTSIPGFSAYEGNYYFMGGRAAYSKSYQDINVMAGAPSPIRVWSGHGPLDLDGSPYLGIGDRGLAQQSAGAIGGFAQGLTLSLSGIEPELIELLDADEVKSAPVVLRRLIFASDGKTLLDASIFDRGRVDTVETIEKIGGGAVIRIAVETAARGLGRSGERMRADSDQRLINSNDGYFKNAAYAGEKMLYWGGRKPTRTSGLTGII